MSGLHCSLFLDEFGALSASVCYHDKTLIDMDLDIDKTLELVQHINANKDFSYTENKTTLYIFPENKEIIFVTTDIGISFKSSYDKVISQFIHDYKHQQ